MNPYALSAVIRRPAKFAQYCISRLRIKAGTFLANFLELPERHPEFSIGRGSYGPLAIKKFGDKANLTVGAFCSFAGEVTVLLGGEHRTSWITTYPFDRKYLFAADGPHSTFAKGDVVIGNDVWIGDGTIVLSGARIGDGAVIAARSVVRGEIPPYSICAGVPATVKKYRFDEATIKSLLEIGWWDWDDEKIAAHVPLLMSGAVEEFCARFSRGARD